MNLNMIANAIFLSVFMVLVGTVSYLLTIRFAKNSKHYKLHRRGLVISISSFLVFLFTIIPANITVINKIYLFAFYLLSLPLMIGDFQRFTLPVPNSIVFVIFGTVILSIVLDMPYDVFYAILKALGFTILFTIFTNSIGFADIYLFAMLLGFATNSVNLFSAMLIGLLISTIILLMLIGIYKIKKHDRFLNMVPYVPAIIMTFFFMISINSLTVLGV